MSRQALALGALTATALLAAAGAAKAENWVYVGRNQYDSVYEIDSDSFSRDGQEVVIRLRVHYGAKSPPNGNGTDSYLARRRVFCNENAYQDLHTDYFAQGRLNSSAEVEEKRTAVSGSIGEDVVKKACAR